MLQAITEIKLHSSTDFSIFPLVYTLLSNQTDPRSFSEREKHNFIS